MKTRQWYRLAAVAGMLAAGLTAEAGEVQDWQRLPVVTAPRLTVAPVLDGVVDRAEWTTAAALAPLVDNVTGVADELSRRVFVGYDDENLYLGFILERPQGAEVPTIPQETGHIDSWRSGDRVEIAIDLSHGHKTYYGFVLYANGAHGEGIGNPGMDRSWDGAWRQAGSLTDKGWQGELAIPFASLGLQGPPAVGEVWGFDFADIQIKPFRAINQWACRGAGWHDFRKFGHLRFGAADDPAARFLTAGETGDNRLAVAFEVVNPADPAAEITGEVQTLRRKDGVAGGVYSYYASIESGGDQAYEAGAVDFEKTTQLSDLIREALGQYLPVETAALTTTTAIPGGQRAALEFAAPSTPGEYLVVYDLRTRAGDPLLQGVFPFRIELPLALTVRPYWLHAQVVDVNADLKKVPLTGPATLVFQLMDNQDAALAETTKAVTGDERMVAAALPTTGLTPGFYKILVIVQDATGQEVARNTVALERPADPPWHNNQLGKIELPAPWTPLTAQPDGTVNIWGRTYDLSAGFPSQIVSQGQSLLAGPAGLELVSGGQPVAWSVQDLTLKHADRGAALFEVALESAVATLTGTAQIEFDGFLWYDLTLTAKGAAPIDSATFGFDLVAERAQLFSRHTLLDDRVLMPKGPTVTKGGSPRLEDTEIPFTPYLWVGDEHGGLAFIAEGPIGWRLTQPERAMRVTAPAGGPAAVRIHFIDAPVQLDKPMRLQFGLQASPIRPMPDERKTQLMQISGPTTNVAWYAGGQAAGVPGVVFHSGWKRSTRNSEWGGWPSRPSDPQRREDLKTAIALAHQHGQKVALYTGWGVATDSDAYKQFGWEMIRVPEENAGFGTMRQVAGLNGAYIDYMAWAIADLIREYDADGVFWDSASNIGADQSLRLGNGWVDDQGRIRPTYPVRATRELFRRIYSLVHGDLKPDGLVVNFGGSVWCINVYADFFHRGEGVPMHVEALREAWDPLEDYRANYSARPFGLGYLAMNKNFKRLAMTVNKHHAVTLLHGHHTKSNGHFDPRQQSYEATAMPHKSIWLARDWLPMDQDRRNFFYYEQTAVQAEPASLLASAFVSADGRRALVVVSNLDPEPVPAARLHVDTAALGLRADGTLKAEDAILGTPVEFQDGRTTVEIAPESYRLLKLWIE
ncbi:MAG: DUF6067 family protein [Candidatus Marinimicrobia bacterium]|nr:DUF6067 family protein [Candidatus Neomarinimicrobiota bacterium]